MANLSAINQLIVETPRGPSVAGRRITIYTILELLKADLDRDTIKEHLQLSNEELNAAVEYIQQHKGEVEKDYREIVRRSEANREYYEELYRQRSRYAHLPIEERVKKMREDLVEKQNSKLF